MTDPMPRPSRAHPVPIDVHAVRLRTVLPTCRTCNGTGVARGALAATYQWFIAGDGHACLDCKQPTTHALAMRAGERE